MTDRFHRIVTNVIKENYPEDYDKRIEKLDYSKTLEQLGYDSIDASMLAIELESEYDVLLYEYEDMRLPLIKIWQICEIKL